MKLPNFLKKKPKDPEVQAAYEEAYRKGRIERAQEEGYRKGKTKPKSFLDKLGNVGGGGGSLDFGNIENVMLGSSKSKRKPKKKKKKKR